MSRPEKSVGSIGAETENAWLFGLFEGGNDDVLLFASQQAVFSGVGIEGEHGDARFLDAEVFVQTAVEDGELFENVLPRNHRGNFREGKVGGDQRHAYALVEQNHERFLSVSGFFLEIFGVSREVESVRLYGVFVDGGRDDGVDESRLQIGRGGFEGEEGGFAGLCCGLGEFHFQFVVETVDHIDFSGGALLGRSDDIEIERRQVESLAVVGGNF